MPTDADRHVETWAERYQRANLFGRLALLGGGAVRVTANAIDSAIKRAAGIAVEAEKAFLDEMDPNISDAKVIEEVDEGRE